jgi:hypothetical protein
VLSSGQRILRVLGTIFLTVCAAMFVLGLTIWEEELRGPMFAIYWSWCFLLAVITIFIALWDMVLVRRTFRRQRRELFRQEFMTDEFVEKMRRAVEKDEKGKTDGDPST